MSFLDRFGPRRARTGIPGEGPQGLGDEGPTVDQGASEAVRNGDASAPSQAQRAPRGDAGAATVRGERGIPSVDRERSVQSRISSALALGTMLLLGAGFLFWYYSMHFSKVREAEDAMKKASATRAAGEMRVPPLGRIEPPRPDARATTAATPVAVSDLLGTAPPPPQATSQPGLAPGGPPQKTPEQLELERQLGQPVLLRTQFTGGASAVAPAAAQAPQALQPNIGSLLEGLQPRPNAETQGGLGAMLVPTPTPAVAAQILPTRRFLLPKGGFIDCTLETAIDSTYDGMTTCIGATDIYSADGKVVLLERGTKYVGEKRGEVKQGQGRVFVLWNEARTPTGVVVNLLSPGTDELGRTGLPGFVDTHFWDRFGAAILISVIDGGLQALAASQQRGGGGGGGTAIVLNPQGTRDVMTEVLRSTVNVPPTVVKNQGDRIQILVARDVDFRPVYALRTHASAQ